MAGRPAWFGFVNEQTPPLSHDERRWFSGRRILVTGAGGFLGSALVRQLAGLNVAHLMLLDVSEYGLYQIDQQLRKRNDCPPYSLVVGSINDVALVREIFTDSPPEIVFHAAARKHVQLMETNLVAAAETNVVGTATLVNAAMLAETGSFVMVSTDKAVDPISVMGATKRIAEQIVLEARVRVSNSQSEAQFTCLRLCNVLGSTGSVAPLFVRQIAAGEAITVTDREATRYFIGSKDAVRYLLRAALTRSRTGLLIPDLREPRRIEELASFLVQAMQPKISPNASRMVYTGLRAADKLHERLFGSTENAFHTQSVSMLEVVTCFDHTTFHGGLATLADSVLHRRRGDLLRAIEELVPGFRPPCSQPAEAAVEWG